LLLRPHSSPPLSSSLSGSWPRGPKSLRCPLLHFACCVLLCLRRCSRIQHTPHLLPPRTPRPVAGGSPLLTPDSLPSPSPSDVDFAPSTESHHPHLLLYTSEFRETACGFPWVPELGAFVVARRSGKGDVKTDC
jgi:hypothetical protein